MNTESSEDEDDYLTEDVAEGSTVSEQRESLLAHPKGKCW